MKIAQCDEAGLEAAVRVLAQGGVAVIPTDTVYGLAASPQFPSAVQRLYTIKNRAAAKPIALLATDRAAAEAFWGRALPQTVAGIVSKHWPGALTVVAPVATSSQSEGIRVPNHAWTRQLLARLGGVLRVTSANMSGKRAATDAPEALRAVGLDADLVVDDGVSPGGVASTVIRVGEDSAPVVLRPGPKDVLRTVMKSVRAQAHRARAGTYSADIARALAAEPAVRAAIAARRPIAVYCAAQNEVSLAAFCAAAHAQGAHLVAPRAEEDAYQFVPYNPHAALEEGPHRILQPPAGPLCAPRDIAVYLVPGLAFTASGARLGYGGGWYDRFLAQAPDAIALGIAYPEQILPDLPQEPTDATLTKIITA